MPMNPVFRVNAKNANATKGKVKFDSKKSSWTLSMLLISIIFAIPTFNISSLLLFLSLTYLSLLLGHSIGMHRLMIHKTFSCPVWLERTLIYIGVIVGFSGPFSVIYTHDIRDWAQRQKDCHDFFSHRRGYFQDLWWQLTSRFEFEKPPEVIIEDHYSKDKFYIFLEKTWQLHQIPLAALLYYFGGFSWVVWGVFLRIFISIAGHWTITYFCRNPGQQKWKVKDACVQASNIPGLGVITYGECWHNNHHAFPESAKIGIYKGQTDPAWSIINFLQKIGLAYNIGKPRNQNMQDDIVLITKRT